ncbi:A/G-specific adenine glycosylase [Candidatus Woesebacteria bacterium]|nr:A/G-specific adenine glycosylase [Candidatus Woesebacteria bacterium]
MVVAHTHFQAYLFSWYRQYGRHTLPWRETTDPYHILVSELMLQQTQVERVLPKFIAFINRFPTTKVLAEASLRDVLILWQGLGYNRRAKYLHKCAQILEERYAGIFPKEYETLMELPGIGAYTASALLAFAYNQPVVLIETNVRAVFLYHFFPIETGITDKEILKKVAETVPEENSREWYWALMDYGSYLKKIFPNPSRRATAHTKQSTFSGSLRQVRGEIIKILTQHEKISTEEVHSQLQSNKSHYAQALEQLLSEELILEDSGILSLK